MKWAWSATETSMSLAVASIDIYYLGNKGADLTARMRRVIRAFLVRICHKQIVSGHGSFDVDVHGKDLSFKHNVIYSSNLNRVTQNIFIMQQHEITAS